MALHDLVGSNRRSGEGLCFTPVSRRAARGPAMVSTFIFMPITYQRSDQRRLITVTVTEPCSVDDISSVIDHQAGEDTWAYALLYDLRAMTDTSTEADLQRLAERVKVARGEGERGPVGIAIRARPALFLLGLMYAKLIKEFVNVEVLLTASQIDAWLVRNAPSSPSRSR
jgi:hypothetical protein